MSIAPGTQLGRYEIRAPLGAGGMGEVYRAYDPKLGREVALKILPAAVAHDKERLRRFELEARSTSELNHPNILTVFDVGTHDSTSYIVAELLAGETLRAHIGGAALPLRKALDYATQLARGLAAAHERGVVHRDLKPENIFIVNDERVKILDFGLAKLVARVDGAELQTDVPTRKLNTEPGAIIGTVGYMSPEQVDGRPADARADIFAFGVILYEMLTGKRAFQGMSFVDTLNAIRKEEPPPLSEINEKVPTGLERIVRRCMEKKPERRFQSASDLAFAIEALAETSGSAQAQAVAAHAGRRVLSRERLAWLMAGVLLLTSLALLVAYSRRAPAPPSAVRFLVYPPEKATLVASDLPYSVAVSPDGRQLALVLNAEGKTHLWLRALDSLTAQPLENTDGAQNPFWSPDGRFIAFFAGGKLKKIATTGGVPTVICDAPPYGNSGTWSGADVILFTTTVGENGIQRVAAAGGEVQQVTKLDTASHEIAHLWPHFLPDGQHFLYLASAAKREDSIVYVASLNGGEPKRFLQVPSRVLYAPPGYLLYFREGALLAQAFDASALQLTGEPATVAERVGNFTPTGNAYFSVSANGEVLAYQTGENPTRLVWYNRAGAEVATVGAPNIYGFPRLAPNDQRLAVDIIDLRDGTNDIWIYDLTRGSAARFTYDVGLENGPVWSPDGRRIAYSHDSNGPPSLFQKAFTDAKGEALIPSREGPQRPLDWSSDGRFLIYRDYSSQTRSDLFLLPMTGARQPVPFVRTPFNEDDARFSPDGRFVAYVSDESGKSEVYVRRTEGGDERWQVSNAGGRDPRWRRDGRELFYLADQTVMAVPVKVGDTFEAGTPAPLFKTEVRDVDIDVTADGQRFIVNTNAGAPPIPITVATNWTATLKR